MYTLAIAYSPNEKEIITLERGYYTIGRSDANDIVISNKFVSSYHCTLLTILDEHNNKDCLIIDGRLYSPKKSTNGTWLNGERIDKQLLKHQDVISFSNHEYPNITFLAEITEVEGGTSPYEYQKVN